MNGLWRLSSQPGLSSDKRPKSGKGDEAGLQSRSTDQYQVGRQDPGAQGRAHSRWTGSSHRLFQRQKFIQARCFLRKGQ